MIRPVAIKRSLIAVILISCETEYYYTIITQCSFFVSAKISVIFITQVVIYCNTLNIFFIVLILIVHTITRSYSVAGVTYRYSLLCLLSTAVTSTVLLTIAEDKSDEYKMAIKH